jgi:hypothetical protein
MTSRSSRITLQFGVPPGACVSSTQVGLVSVRIVRASPVPASATTSSSRLKPRSPCVKNANRPVEPQWTSRQIVSPAMTWQHVVFTMSCGAFVTGTWRTREASPSAGDSPSAMVASGSSRWKKWSASVGITESPGSAFLNVCRIGPSWCVSISAISRTPRRSTRCVRIARPSADHRSTGGRSTSLRASVTSEQQPSGRSPYPYHSTPPSLSRISVPDSASRTQRSWSRWNATQRPSGEGITDVSSGSPAVGPEQTYSDRSHSQERVSRIVTRSRRSPSPSSISSNGSFHGSYVVSAAVERAAASRA